MDGESVRIAVNGFGRIGRHVVRRALQFDDIQVVAVNNRAADPGLLAYLFKHDSVLGTYPGDVRAVGSSLFIDGRTIEVVSRDNPELLPWAELRVAIAVEATGRFTTGALARRHRTAGARAVLVTAPARGVHITLVVGVNDEAYDPARHLVVSAASCTTACLAPMAKVLHEHFGIEGGLMTTVHAYTRDQELLDGTNRDPRRARAASLNVAPTKTGAARTIGEVLPELAGRLDGLALRVPVPDVSIVDLTVSLKEPATPEAVNRAFIDEAAGRLTGILGVCDEPLVSSDFRGDERSCVVDLASTRAAPNGQIKVLGWYDNEWSYACRVVDLVRLMGRQRQAVKKGEPQLEVTR